MDLSSLLTHRTDGLVDLAILIIRVFVGPCFVVHALGKLGVVGSGTMQGFAEWLDSLGVPFAGVQARMAMLSELLGGTLLALGFMTRPACIVLIGTMLVAGMLGHKGAGYLITNEPPGAEYTINLAAICLVVLIAGPGRLSLDAILF